MKDKTILRDSQDVEEKETTFDPPLEAPTPKEDKPVETATQTPTKVLVRCPDCPWRAGFKDEHTYCETCNGAGRVEAEPLA